MNCSICKKPILTDHIVILKDGRRSMQRLKGRKRTRCERCQKAYWNVRRYMLRQRKKNLRKQE